jgi:hypothetical protein
VNPHSCGLLLFSIYSIFQFAGDKTKALLRGLGELICRKFAQAGCSVAINYNASADRAKALAAKIEKEDGMKAVVIKGVRLTKNELFAISPPRLQVTSFN